jgi:hypothetical protein
MNTGSGDTPRKLRVGDICGSPVTWNDYLILAAAAAADHTERRVREQP